MIKYEVGEPFVDTGKVFYPVVRKYLFKIEEYIMPTILPIFSDKGLSYKADDDAAVIDRSFIKTEIVYIEECREIAERRAHKLNKEAMEEYQLSQNNI